MFNKGFNLIFIWFRLYYGLLKCWWARVILETLTNFEKNAIHILIKNPTTATLAFLQSRTKIQGRLYVACMVSLTPYNVLCDVIQMSDIHYMYGSNNISTHIWHYILTNSFWEYGPRYISPFLIGILLDHRWLGFQSILCMDLLLYNPQIHQRWGSLQVRAH